MANVTAHMLRDKYKTTIEAEGKTIIADEPQKNGGTNLGFSPGELLGAALASCTSITLRMYADRKNWPLEKVEVNVQVNPFDAVNGTSIVRNIKLAGDLSKEQELRLLEIANHCPMHKMLLGTIHIQTNLAAKTTLEI